MVGHMFSKSLYLPDRKIKMSKYRKRRKKMEDIMEPYLFKVVIDESKCK